MRPGVRLPYWLNEGFAEYVGYSAVEKGRLVPGHTQRARLHHVRMVQGEVAILRTETQARLSLEEVKGAVRRGEGLTLAAMLDADRTDFYGERLQLYYGMSWLLVHYLRHGEEGWSDGAFPSFLSTLARASRSPPRWRRPTAARRPSSSNRSGRTWPTSSA